MPQTPREIALIELVLHELRTPLTVATSSLPEALGSRVALPPAQQAAADRVGRAISALTTLGDQLKAWARAAASAPMTTASLAPMLRTASDVEEPVRRQVSVGVSRVPDELRVAASGPSMEGALRSLVAAVVRAAGSRGTVPIDVTAIESVVRIAIGDPGEPTTSPEFGAEFVGGLGFALPLARATIEVAGGRVWSRSSDGRLVGIGVELQRA